MTRPLANITREVLAPVWMRHYIPTEVIASRLGVTRQGLSWKAKSLGLPSRAKNRMKFSDDETFTRMWMAGVSTAEMAKAFGYRHPQSITTRRRALGLPARMKSGGGKGGWGATISLAEFHEIQLAEQMTQRARKERAKRRPGR